MLPFCGNMLTFCGNMLPFFGKIYFFGPPAKSKKKFIILKQKLDKNKMLKKNF